MTPPVICTVVTKSHLAYARALNRLFRQHHPEGRCVVLVADEPDGCFDPAAEPFEILSIDDLGVTSPACLRFQYTAFELCNALKPFLLLHLLKGGVEQLLYLDSDIGVYGSLEELFARLKTAPVLLTPHSSGPIPADGFWPTPAAIKSAGNYNAGVVGVAADPESIRFLQWWRDKLLLGCIDDPENGIYVDQKYLEEVPALFPATCVMDHPGVNTAHFNLHSRSLGHEGGRWTCNGRSLLLFHFTQANYQTGEFWPPVNRPLVQQQPLIRELIRSYGMLLEECGIAETRRWPCTWQFFPDGTRISPALRREFLEWRKKTGGDNDPFHDTEWLARQRRLALVEKTGELLRLPARGAAWLKRRLEN